MREGLDEKARWSLCRSTRVVPRWPTAEVQRAARLMINSFGPDSGIAACIPAPYKLLQNRDRKSADWMGQVGEEQ